MTATTTNLLVVLGFTVATALSALSYFRRYQPTRPPIGVFNLRDVAILLGAIIVVPYLYIALPLVVVAILLGVLAAMMLTLVLEPIVRRRWLVGASALTLVAADIAVTVLSGPDTEITWLVNNVVLVLLIVAITNLWAQSGFRARDLTVFAAALTLYDLVATTQLGIMAALITRLAGLPFAPLMRWGDAETGLAIGLGDLLVVAAFPLVMRKAFGVTASLVALVLGVGAVAGALALVGAGWVGIFPAMTLLVPLTVAQYAWWRRSHGPERRTWQYLRAEPLRHQAAPVTAS